MTTPPFRQSIRSTMAMIAEALTAIGGVPAKVLARQRGRPHC